MHHASTTINFLIIFYTFSDISTFVSDNDECTSHGNTFRVLPGTNCKSYNMWSAGTPMKQKTCPDNTVFDTTKCVCNWEKDVNCGR